jgi:hypothetical protein
VRAEVAQQKEDADMEKAFSMFDKSVKLLVKLHLNNDP